MPQLWTETFVTQYFWLVVILLGFYYLAITEILPQIAFTLKTRKELESNSSTTTSNKIEDKSIISTKSLLSTILTPVQSATKVGGSNVLGQIQSNLNTIKADFIQKNIN